VIYSALAVLLVSPVLAATLEAQEEIEIAAARGSRVRLTSPLLDRRIVGTLMAYDANYLMILPAKKDADVIRVPRDQVATFELSSGRESNWLLGGVVGALAGGAGVGGLYAVYVVGWCEASTWGSNGASESCEDERSSIGKVVAISAAAGFAIGAVVGALAGKEHWETVDPPSVTPLISLKPERGRTAVVLGLRLRI